MSPTATRAGSGFDRADEGVARAPARLQRSRTLAFVRSFAPAAFALALIVGAGALTERLTTALARADLRADVVAQAGDVRMRLDAAIESRIRALAALSGALRSAGAGDAADFAALNGEYFDGDPMVRAVAARAASGLALISPADSGYAPAMARLVAPGAPEGRLARTLAAPGAPVVLVAPGGPGPRTAAALDLRTLYDVVRGPAPPPEAAQLDVALIETSGGSRQLLLGPPGVLAADPVIVDLAFPAGAWRIAAAPRGGWAGDPRQAWGIWLATILVAAAIVGPMLRTRHLVAERQRHIAALRDRESQLARVSRRLGLALDASQVGVWEYDIAADALVWDTRMDELYALPHDRPRVYADWRDRLHADDVARAEAEFRAAIERTGRYESEYRLTLPGGGLRHVRAIGAVYDEPGRGATIVGVNWDVSADVAHRAELEDRRQDAEAASVAKSQFLATMSHEIRTPMSGVLGMIDLMLGGALDRTQRARAEVARDSAGHLLTLLNDILDFSRLEAHRVTLEPEPVRLEALVSDVVALLAPGAAQRGVILAAQVDPATPLWIACDPTRLRQVLLNLVGNALKFTDAGRVDVAVGYAPQGNRGVIEAEVRDTGVGIAEVDRARLFERFVQADGSHARQRGGAGLGLAISRQLVELMGGEIAVDSAPGHGSTFRFWIPAAPCAAPAPAAACPAAPAGPPLRILLAEDNPTNQQILSSYLARAGHSVRVVANGADAVAEAARGAVDLVLMDIQMPEMDGLSATRRIRALAGAAGRVPIVALTANAMQGDRETYLASGMTDYLTKPVVAAALHAAIARASRSPAARCA